MRNALVEGNMVITVDNAVAIGEKSLDVVYAPDETVAQFTMRVLLLEQMCANATIHYLTIGNGSGEEAFTRYMRGIRRVFDEVALPLPQYVASTETNMPTQQSALTITAIGRQQPAREKGMYRYIIGHPHVGQSVLNYPHEIAPLEAIYTLWKEGVITHVWPTGSKGLAYECQRFFHEVPPIPVAMSDTCGPSTVILAYANAPLVLDVPMYAV